MVVDYVPQKANLFLNCDEKSMLGVSDQIRNEGINCRPTMLSDIRIQHSIILEARHG